jgi:hypothetical protein
LALLVLAGLGWFWPDRSVDPPPSLAAADPLSRLPATSAGVLAPPAALAPPPARAPLVPPMRVFSDAQGDPAAARVSADLARWISLDAGRRIEAVRASGWADALSHAGEPGHLGIVRYDALQAARIARAPGSAALRVVAPLYREDIQLLVRADSPLRFIHEIRGRRLNVGAAASSRALTAGTLYARMFGVPPSPQQLDDHGEAAGLADLLAGHVDVLVHVGTQDSAGLGRLLSATGVRLKLLALDAAHPAARKALQQFLPSRTRAVGDGSSASQDTVPTLAVMSFLVTSEAADPESRERLGQLAHALCQRRGVLRSLGDPLWRDVDLSMRLDVGWPYDETASRELGNCLKETAGLPSDPDGRGSTADPQPPRRSPS